MDRIEPAVLLSYESQLAKVVGREWWVVRLRLQYLPVPWRERWWGATTTGS